jgi:hypothetical protein
MILHERAISGLSGAVRWQWQSGWGLDQDKSAEVGHAKFRRWESRCHRFKTGTRNFVQNYQRKVVS